MSDLDSQEEGPAAAGASSPAFAWLGRLCVVCAGLGAVVIFLTAVVVTYSVVMRSLGLGGLRGDFELVELSCAASASLFLPWCQFTKGHVMVDLFTTWMPGKAQIRLDGVWTLVFALVWALLCWRLSHGLGELRSYGDRTMLLRAPIWMVYIPAVIGTGLSAVVAFATGTMMVLRGSHPAAEA